MLSFLVPTETQSEKSERPSLQLRENTQEKQQEIAIRNFPIQNNTRVELSYPEIRGAIIKRRENNYSEQTRGNLQWKGGQLECPNGSYKNSNSRARTYFCYQN